MMQIPKACWGACAIMAQVAGWPRSCGISDLETRLAISWFQKWQDPPRVKVPKDLKFGGNTLDKFKGVFGESESCELMKSEPS
jgi:hypothetical protein